METIKPMKVGRTRANPNEAADTLTSAEIGKLWAAYMGNSMSACVLAYFLQHTEDEDIKKTVETALRLTEQFVQTIKDIFVRDHLPVPEGFSGEDVNLGAPRVYADEFYLHYLRYVGKAGMSIYSIAVPLMTRSDVRAFFTNCLESTIKLMNQVNDVLQIKGMLIKPPYIPMPDKVDFVQKHSYLNGFLGDVRPLHSLEITHLFDNVQNNATSRAALIGFSQTARSQKVRDYFVRGKDISAKHMEVIDRLLHKEDLPSHPILDHLVTNSTFSPFSDKLMLFHKLDMFSMRIRTYGNSMAVCARHDIGAMYARFVMEVAKYSEDGANILIDHGWLEQMPQAADRDALVIK